MLRTTTANGIKESPTCYCSRGSQRHTGTGLCDVASGSAGFCAITIRTPFELAQQIGKRSDDREAAVRSVNWGCHIKLLVGKLTSVAVERLSMTR
jgi:hypothetical protein